MKLNPKNDSFARVCNTLLAALAAWRPFPPGARSVMDVMIIACYGGPTHSNCSNLTRKALIKACTSLRISYSVAREGVLHCVRQGILAETEQGLMRIEPDTSKWKLTKEIIEKASALAESRPAHHTTLTLTHSQNSNANSSHEFSSSSRGSDKDGGQHLPSCHENPLENHENPSRKNEYPSETHENSLSDGRIRGPSAGLDQEFEALEESREEINPSSSNSSQVVTGMEEEDGIEQDELRLAVDAIRRELRLQTTIEEVADLAPRLGGIKRLAVIVDTLASVRRQDRSAKPYRSIGILIQASNNLQKWGVNATPAEVQTRGEAVIAAWRDAERQKRVRAREERRAQAEAERRGRARRERDKQERERRNAKRLEIVAARVASVPDDDLLTHTKGRWPGVTVFAVAKWINEKRPLDFQDAGLVVRALSDFKPKKAASTAPQPRLLEDKSEDTGKRKAE